MIHTRLATAEDLAEITAIYNEAVLTTTSTFDTEIKTEEDRFNWFINRDESFPVLVAEYSGHIAGYASLNKWSDKKAYNICAEISVYVHSEHRGKGIGKLLVQTTVAIAENSKLKSIIARITEGNDHSIYLHQKAGFAMVGTLKQVGEKFGKLLDVTIMQKLF